METVSNCPATTGDTVANTTEHMASLSLDQFMQMDESGKTEKECHAELPDETHDEAEEMKEDVMLTTPEIFSKNIVFLAPGVTPSPVAEEKFRPSRLFMELAYARCQRIMGGIALDPSRTCTNRPPFDVSLPEYVLPEAMFSFATKGER